MKRIIKIVALSIILIITVLLVPGMSVLAYSTPDRYESNNTWQTATNYSNTVMINDSISHAGSLFTLGFRSANLTTPNDIDWYKQTFRANTQGRAIIKNLGGANYDFQIFYLNNTTGQLESVAAYSEYNGSTSTEKAKWFNVNRAGTYYMMVFSNGDDSNSYYYFYFNERNKREVFNINNVQLGGSYIYGSTYMGMTYNLANYFPEGAIAHSLYVTENLSGKYQRIDKQVVTADGKHLSSINQSGEIFFLSTLYLDQRMTIKGKSTRGDFIFWAPVLKGKFYWSVQPHAGY